MEQPYEELLGALPGQPALNVDETGHKHGGLRYWTWCFRAGLYTLFKIDPTRSADVLINVLGAEFDGVLGCDYFSAYRRFHREFGVELQFCLAHLIRDVKYLATLADPRDRAYGEGLREALRSLFGVIHRRGEWGEAEFRSRLARARRGAAARDVERAADASGEQPGEAVRDARRELFPVHHGAGDRTDEQPGGAGDPIRGDRPPDHAGDAERPRRPLVRADLDGDGDLRPTRAIGV